MRLGLLAVLSVFCLLPQLPRRAACDALRRLACFPLLGAGVAPLEAVRPPLHREDELRHAAAGAGDLLRSDQVAYLRIALLVAHNVGLGGISAGRRRKADSAQPDALGRHLVDADNFLAPFADERQVPALAVIIAVLERLWVLVVNICLLFRLQAFGLLDLLLLWVHGRFCLVLCDLLDLAVLGGQVALHALVLELGNPVEVRVNKDIFILILEK